jgi:hypothetical protein
MRLFTGTSHKFFFNVMIQQHQNFKQSFSIFAFQTRRLSFLFTTKGRNA